jgi:uncharacterized membrane protein
MKERYIKQVKKEFGLCLSRKKRNEIIRDLNEIFASALEHGETEQQIIERLGTPYDFVKNTIEQFDTNNTAPKRQRGIISSAIFLLVAVVAFSIFTIAQFGKAPNNAIGAADAMTNIQVEGALGIDIAKMMLVIGLIAVVIAIIQIIRTINNSRR